MLDFPIDLDSSLWVPALHATWTTTTFYYSSLTACGSHIQRYLHCSWLCLHSEWLSLLPLHFLAEMQMVQAQSNAVSHFLPPSLTPDASPSGCTFMWNVIAVLHWMWWGDFVPLFLSSPTQQHSVVSPFNIHFSLFSSPQVALKLSWFSVAFKQRQTRDWQFTKKWSELTQKEQI